MKDGLSRLDIIVDVFILFLLLRGKRKDFWFRVVSLTLVCFEWETMGGIKGCEVAVVVGGTPTTAHCDQLIAARAVSRGRSRRRRRPSVWSFQLWGAVQSVAVRLLRALVFQSPGRAGLESTRFRLSFCFSFNNFFLFSIWSFLK